MITPLQDITLTMIVRDELMNPAGGLLPMLEYHLPYFDHAVVLDTGSVDGTRELLEHLAGEYPQLRVYDAKFEGYGYARMKANEHVQTEYTLMLDADERIEELEQLMGALKKIQRGGYIGKESISFRFFNILSDGFVEQGWGWNPRLALKRKVGFRSSLKWECSLLEDTRENLEVSTRIFHFRVADHGYKREIWYSSLEEHIRQGTAP